MWQPKDRPGVKIMGYTFYFLSAQTCTVKMHLNVMEQLSHYNFFNT